MFNKKPFTSNRFGGKGQKSFGGGGGGGGGWKRSFGDRDSGPREMHRATCAECNNPCEVPFKPNGRKPVLCSNCFVKDETGAARRISSTDRFDRAPAREQRSFGGDSSKNIQVEEQLRTVNAKLDAILKILNDNE